MVSSHESGGPVDKVIMVDLNAGCKGMLDAGNRQVKASFGWRWTHNEELCVAS
jgi:hypothetical protein